MQKQDWIAEGVWAYERHTHDLSYILIGLRGPKLKPDFMAFQKVKRLPRMNKTLLKILESIDIHNVG